MKTCEWCDTIFDTQEAEDYFNCETYLLSYDRISKCLCGECAVRAIEEKQEDVYFETCECCGKTFDLAEDECEFDNHFSSCSGTSLRDYWNGPILCAECAIDSIGED